MRPTFHLRINRLLKRAVDISLYMLTIFAEGLEKKADNSFHGLDLCTI